MGLSVCYAAAPFEVSAVQNVLDYIDLLILNEIEAQQLEVGLGISLAELPVTDIIVTLGANGCRWLHSGNTRVFDAILVEAVDTTGAGDTFAGYAVAGLSQGLAVEKALLRASAAAALSTTKKGTADAIPDHATVEAFLAS